MPPFFTTPGMRFGAPKPKLEPVTPAASTTPAPSSSSPRPRTGFFFGSVPPGLSLGKAPAPLASPSIGMAVAPNVALFAAVAGARALYSAAGTGTTTNKPGVK